MSSLTPVFLRLDDGCGGRHVTELIRYGEGSTFYLPDKIHDKLDVQTSSDAAHSIARLDLFDTYVGVSIDADPAGTSVLMSGDRAIKIPLSSAELRMSFILRESDCFITTAGQWSIEWDTTGAISTSRRVSTPAIVEPNEIFLDPAYSGYSEETNHPSSSNGLPKDMHIEAQLDNRAEHDPKLCGYTTDSNSSRLMIESDEICGQDKNETHSRKRRMCEIEQGYIPNKLAKTDHRKKAACSEEDRAVETNEGNKGEVPMTIASVAMSVSASNGTTHLSKATGQSIPKPETIVTRVHTHGCDQQSLGAAETAVSEAHPERLSRVHPSKLAGSNHRTSNRQSQPVVVFSTTASKVQNDVEVMASYKRLGGLVANDLQKASIFCVGSNSLKKTAKFILAVASGRDIVTDQWLEDVHTTRRFPNPQSYLPCDAEKEQEWRFTLSDAIARGKNGLTLLNGIDVVLTSQLQVELDDLKAEVKKIALTMGANRVGMKLPKQISAHATTVIIGSSNADVQTSDVKNLHLRMYSKDLLSMAALRGVLELDSDEFLIS